MRHDHLLLSEAESRKVIEEVNSWCRRTGTNYNKLVTAARVAPCIRSSVRFHGARMTEATASKLRAAMKAHPRGIGKGEHKARVREVARETVERQRARNRRDYPAARSVIDRSPCPVCNARRDYGCEHWARFESRAYA